MNRMVMKSRLNSEGILQLTLPLGLDEADKEVQITVEPVLPVTHSPEDWQHTILSTAGKWRGEFERPEQGQYEERDRLP